MEVSIELALWDGVRARRKVFEGISRYETLEEALHGVQRRVAAITGREEDPVCIMPFDFPDSILPTTLRWSEWALPRLLAYKEQGSTLRVTGITAYIEPRLREVSSESATDQVRPPRVRMGG